MRRTALAVLIAVSALAVTGCATDGTSANSASASASPPPTQTSSPIPTADRALGCDSLLSDSRAAVALGVPSADLVGSLRQATQYTTELVRETAQGNGGLFECGWYSTKTGARVTVQLAQNMADAFTATEPDVDDGLNDLLPLAVGRTAYGVCRDVAGCRAEVLDADTWLSIVQSPRPSDDSVFTALVSEIVAGVQGRLDPPKPATSAECGVLLPDDELIARAGMAQPILSTGTGLGTRGSIRTATAARAGYVECSWTDAAGSATVMVSGAPHGAQAWQQMSLASNLFTALEPADAIGNRAMVGCNSHQCEVDALAAGTWWRVTTTGDATQVADLARRVIENAK